MALLSHASRWSRCGVLLLALLALLAPRGDATEVSREFRLKAAFLFNFTQFVEWPADAFASAEAPIRIGVLGSDPFGPALDEVVRGERVRGRPLEVVRAASAEQLRGCHLVFVGDSEKERTAAVVGALADTPVLTVSDNPDFASAGGVVRFFLEGAKVRFEINPDAAEQHRLKLSAQLLALGRLVPRATR